MIDLSANLLPPLSGEEEERLRDSIKENGYDPAYPVIKDEEGNILDGWNRDRIARELGIEPVVVVKTGLSQWEKVKLAIGRNVDRRQLDRWQTGRLAAKLLPEAEAAAAQRQHAGKRTSGSTDPKVERNHHAEAREAAGEGLGAQFNPPANDATIARHREAGRAKEEVGSLLGVSRRTVDRAVQAIEKLEADIEAAGIPEETYAPVIAALDAGNISLLKAKQVLGLAPTFEPRSPEEQVPDGQGQVAKHELMVAFINTTRALAVGFTAEDGIALRELADDLIVPLRTIERHYCEARKR